MLTGTVAGFMLALALAIPAMASLSQGFATTSVITSGSMVSLDEKASGTVVAADTTNAQRLFGVVVPASSASISLTGSGTGQVQIVTTGTAGVLVSTQGGEIKSGDYISVSSIAGVGMKASGRTRVIGTAQANFDGKDATAKRSIDDPAGKREVALGEIPVVVGVSTYSKDDLNTYLVPPWLQSISNTLAGKSVSAIRVIIAGLILVVALVSITVLLYSAVRNSIISIGRNPLSRSSVLQGLLQVFGISVMIMAVTTGAMYVVITR